MVPGLLQKPGMLNYGGKGVSNTWEPLHHKSRLHGPVTVLPSATRQAQERVPVIVTAIHWLWHDARALRIKPFLPCELALTCPVEISHCVPAGMDT